MILFLFSGCFSALFAVVAELAVFSFLVPSGAGMDPWHLGLVSGLSVIGFVTFVFVAVIEESLKLLVLNRQTRQSSIARTWATFALFGLGFALTEIALASMTTDAGIIPPIPIIGILAIHTITPVLYGLTIPFGRKRLFTVLIVGISAHLLYDVLLALA
ncbi:MAG: hypothetical protein HGB34_04330 [Candidatus Moranbacteria bacterium]|nr:hypothetical protein [Candidatus Moranbacteria bacterium]